MTPRFPTLFTQVILRESWRHPVLALLNVAGIALGVAVFLAVQVANRAAIESFRSAASLTTGRANIELRGEMPDDLLPAVQAVPGVRAATPLVEGVVAVADHPGEYLRILGVDPFTGRDVFSFSLRDSGGPTFDFEKWLRDPDVIAVQPAARKMFGSRIAVLAGTRHQELDAGFDLVPDDPLGAVDARVAALDIGWAQELLGLAGRLSSIQVAVEDPAHASEVIGRLRALVPADVVVSGPDGRRREMETMLGAFHLNLTAMSLVSVVVGMFLITNTVSAAVMRRRTQVATLRACGATRLEIRMLFLGEALGAALLGVGLGILLAPVLVRAAAPALSLSISSLYELVRIGETPVSPAEMVVAAGIGLAAAIVAAWRPASEAARTQPARILRPGAMDDMSSPLRRAGLVWAVVFLLAGAGLSAWALSGGAKILSFAAAGAVLVGFTYLVPWVAAAIALCARGWGRLSHLAADHLVRSLRRNAVTIGALAAAVAMAVSVAVMIHSFRASVARWIDRTLVADLYVAPAVNELSGPIAFLPAEVQAWSTTRPEISGLATYRELDVTARGQPVTMAVLSGTGRGEFDWLPRTPAEAGARFASGRGVVVSESLARRMGLAPGEALPIATPTGLRDFEILGIARDYTSERGLVFIRREAFSQWWNDPRIHSAGFTLRDPAEASAVAGAFRAQFGAAGEFSLHDNASLRARVFQIFDQTFAITGVLRGVAILVAVAGVLLSFSVLVIEREREVGVLRALGASRAQIFGILLGEAFLLGLAATLSGVVSGCVLALVLTWVVNAVYFGWTIALSFPLGALAATPLWLIPAVLIASLLPAWRAARIAPARAVRFE